MTRRVRRRSARNADPGRARHPSQIGIGRKILPWVLSGVAVTAIFFGGVGTWAAYAPLKGAVIGQGTVIVETQRKQVQHLDGGIVTAIHVDEGDDVREGDVLVTLDEADERAQIELLENEYYTQTARRARLDAEQAGEEVVPVFDVAAWGNAERLKEAVALQQNIMDARRELMAKTRSSLRSRSRQIEEQIRGFELQRSSVEGRLELIEEEVADQQGLLDKGLTQKTKLLALRRQELELEGTVGDLTQRVAASRAEIERIENELLRFEAQRLSEIEEERSEAIEKLRDAIPQITRLRLQLARKEIPAPVTGRIVGLNVFTIGGVVRPGESIMEIVPAADRFVVDARVEVNDVDSVEPGQAVQINFPAFTGRDAPTFDGEVVSVSADRLVNEQTGLPYYTARIVPDPIPRGRLEAMELRPGMATEVYFVTGERTLLDMLVSPIEDSLRRAVSVD